MSLVIVNKQRSLFPPYTYCQTYTYFNQVSPESCSFECGQLKVGINRTVNMFPVLSHESRDITGTGMMHVRRVDDSPCQLSREMIIETARLMIRPVLDILSWLESV